VIELRLGRSRARGAPPGHLLLTTIRSHDQFNTTVYGGCAAAYYAETNVLAPLDSVAETSNNPNTKSIVIRLEPSAADSVSSTGSTGSADSVGSADSPQEHNTASNSGDRRGGELDAHVAEAVGDDQRVAVLERTAGVHDVRDVAVAVVRGDLAQRLVQHPRGRASGAPGPAAWLRGRRRASARRRGRW